MNRPASIKIVPAPRVLWAEDSPADQLLIRSALETTPFHGAVVFVQDGSALLAELGRWRPALVVLDMHMPRMGGVEALEQVWALPGFEDLPVAAFSSAQGPEVARCKALGVVSYEVKPTDFDAFAAAVVRLVSLRPSQPARMERAPGSR